MLAQLRERQLQGGNYSLCADGPSGPGPGAQSHFLSSLGEQGKSVARVPGSLHPRSGMELLAAGFGLAQPRALRLLGE